MKKIIVSLLLSLLFFSCDITENRYVSVINESDRVIYCFISKTDIIKIKDISETASAVEIQQNDVDFLVPVTRGKWEEFLALCDDKTARFYIVEKNTVTTYGWDVVFSKSLYTKEILITEDVLGDTMNVVYE